MHALRFASKGVRTVKPAMYLLPPLVAYIFACLFGDCHELAGAVANRGDRKITISGRFE